MYEAVLNVLVFLDNDKFPELNEKINEYGYSIHWINSTDYKDIIKIANTKSFAGIEFNYDGDGLFSRINIITSSNQDIKNTVITALNSLKV